MTQETDIAREADRGSLKKLFQSFEKARQAKTYEEYEEAISDLTHLRTRSMSLALATSLLIVQIERPVLIPLALAACLSSLGLLIHRAVS